MENQPIIIEEMIDAQVSEVWRAITEKEEMKKWYFDLKEFIPEVGFKFKFSGGQENGKKYLHLCEVTSVKPRERISYTWKYEGYEGESEVIFELIDQVDHTLLKLTHKGLNTFPKDNPDFETHNFVQGWNELIHKSLKKYLES